MGNKINISEPQIEEKEIKAVVNVLKSRNIVQGELVAKIEEKFSKLCGVEYAIATSNGTSALHTALFAAGVGEGDEVITTPFTFVATVNSILMVGATPVLVDIDEGTFNINPREIEKAVSKKTKAIITVDLYGQPVDYSEIRKIAKKHKLIIIEDAAQSVNASYKGKKTGNLADIGCFSFYATKNITCGEGGMVTTNNKNFYIKAKEFINHGQRIGKNYDYVGIGYNYRMTDIAAAILLEQLKKVDMFTKKRQKNANRYNNAFFRTNGIIIPEIAPNRTHVFHQYTIRVAQPFPITRDRLKVLLESKGIMSRIYYPIPLYRFFHIKKDSRIFDCPVTDRVSREVLSLPVHPALSKSEIDYIIDAVIGQ